MLFLRVLLLCLLATNFVAYRAIAADKKESAYERVMRTGTLRCGYAPWPVYFDVDPNTKKLTGLNKELSDAAARILGLKIEYIETSFSNKVIDLNSGKIDAMCGDGPWILTSLRAQNYTRQFYYADVYLYGRHDENRFKKIEDLNAKDVSFIGIDGDLSV